MQSKLSPEANLLKILCFTFIFSFPLVLMSQVDITTDDLEISENLYFKKISLDGNVAYMNELTNEIISREEYEVLCASVMDVIINEPKEHKTEIEDYWSSDKINPYKGVKLTTPFKIQFDQKTFTHPVDHDIVITSRFGRRRRGPHRGLDIDLETGDFVRSVLPGKVRFVGYSRGHGKTVVVRHANEIETVYAHLSAYTVRMNDTIPEGQIVGFGGNTGNSRGSHLHLEVRYKGVCIHPEYVFDFDGEQKIRGTELWITNAWQSPKKHSSYRRSELTPLHTEEEAIAAQKAEPRFHKVRKGDTLYAIARRNSLRVKEICEMNGITQKSILSIGQLIKVR